MTGFPLGVGRRALDEFAALAPTKHRGSPPTRVAEDGHTQVELGRAEAGLLSARSFAYDAIADAWTTAVGGDRPTQTQEGRVQLALQQAMRAAVDAVDTAFTLSGSAAVFDGHPLQRCFRDIHTARQHVAFHSEGFQGYARMKVGLEDPT